MLQRDVTMEVYNCNVTTVNLWCWWYQLQKSEKVF